MIAATPQESRLSYAAASRLPRRARRRSLLAAVATGTALGLVNSLANVLGSPFSPHRVTEDGVWVLQLIGAVLGTTWAWAVGAFCCGWWGRRWWHAPMLAVVGMWCADVAYYLSDWLGGLDDALATEEMRQYALLGTALGIVLGTLAGCTRHGRRWSILPVLIVTTVLCSLRQRSGADVVADAAQPTQSALTFLLFVALTIRWLRQWTRGRAASR